MHRAPDCGISGHASLREVERYTKAVDQARLAKDAINKEQLRHSGINPGDKVRQIKGRVIEKQELQDAVGDPGRILNQRPSA